MAERVAYLLKGYPRISELFIASEIHRLEELGVPLHLYVIKQADETVRHPVVDRIRAVPRRLPAVGSLSGESLPRWLRGNLRPFLPAIRHAAVRHPRGLARALGAAVAQSVRARKGLRPRKIYAKELLQAIALVELIDADGGTDHVHAHFAHGTTTVAWLAAMICDRPLSFTAHAKDIYDASLNPAGLLARKMRAARFLTTCTCANHEHLRGVCPDADVRLVYHGLNADFQRLLEDAPPRRVPPRLAVVSVGRQVPKKGFDVLVEAIDLLVARGIDASLVIAGEDGPQHGALVARIDELGLVERVRFAGIVSQVELLDLYRCSSLFALACRIDDRGDRDGIPNVLVEAMAAGLPVVSTDVSGIPEVIEDDVTGLLVPPEDPVALADAMARIAADPTVAARLGEAAAALIAERFDGDALARELAGMFRESR